MASSERKPDDTLRALLEAEGETFDFFQAVQLLHRLAPDATPVGELGPVESEPVRFVHDPRLIFHPSDIAYINPRGSQNHAEVCATFLGLFGAASPLATTMSEELIWAEDANETSLKAFYDIFHHRLLSLYYRAWKKYRLFAGFRIDGSDVFSRRVMAFVGVDFFASTHQPGLSPMARLSLSPLLGSGVRSAHTLQLVLEHLLPGADVSIESFIERRVPIDEDQRVVLGVRNTIIGTDLTIGMRVFDRSGRFRVCIGSVDYETFESLMPGGSQHAKLRKVVEQFTTGVLEAELELRLGGDQSPRFQLGVERGALLGVSTHLVSRPRGATRVRVVLSEDATEAKPVILSDEDG